MTGFDLTGLDPTGFDKTTLFLKGMENEVSTCNP